MIKVGFVGWRGMVGSVLLSRMEAMDDFSKAVEFHFFSTSNHQGVGPTINDKPSSLYDAYDLEMLSSMDIILTAQGGDYTERVYEPLRDHGFSGYWLDAASTLRMADDSIIVLDPINRAVIDEGLSSGIKNFVGGNCTVSLMLMALGQLFREQRIKRLSIMTYQAASGAGAQGMLDLLGEMSAIGDYCKNNAGRELSALDASAEVHSLINQPILEDSAFCQPLAANVLPYIDSEMSDGRSKEEWKADVETNKILGLTGSSIIPVDGLCVRVPTLRAHAQAITMELNEPLAIEEIGHKISSTSPWTEFIPNHKGPSIEKLTPAYVAGTLQIPVGRLRALNWGPNVYSIFTVGDQLMWGAAEPLRRMLWILHQYILDSK